MGVDSLEREFLKREVDVKVSKKTIGDGEHAFEYEEHETDDPILKEMEEKAAKIGMVIRLWFPGTVGTMDYRIDRINVRVEPVGDKFVITDIHVG